MGVSIVILPGVTYILLRVKAGVRLVNVGSVLALTLLTITGHLGAKLTHGEDYLTGPLM
jgi:hypothetical protein